MWSILSLFRTGGGCSSCSRADSRQGVQKGEDWLLVWISSHDALKQRHVRMVLSFLFLGHPVVVDEKGERMWQICFQIDLSLLFSLSLSPPFISSSFLQLLLPTQSIKLVKGQIQWNFTSKECCKCSLWKLGSFLRLLWAYLRHNFATFWSLTLVCFWPPIFLK